MKKILFLLAVLQLLGACSMRKAISVQPATQAIKELRLLDEYEVPYLFSFKNTTVGGLSGIDYDRKRNQYYLVCDDRSSINPSRFYTARIAITARQIDTIAFLEAVPLQMPGGSLYPDSRVNPSDAADPEAIRYDPRKEQLVISSEGERIVSGSRMALQDPFIHYISKEGKYKDSFALPPEARMHATEKGLRQNGTFEGISFGDNYKSLYVSIEEPLYEDGARAGLGPDSTGWIRIIKYDVRTKKQVAQYAYQIDAIPHPPVSPGDFKVNGVSEILWLGNNKLLIIERSFSTGRLNLSIRVYIADLSNASDISSLISLQNASFQPASKTLLLNMESLNRNIYNIEGVCFGPLLPNGHQTLLFVADDNFSKDGKNQFLLFEIIPG